jgi:outer membrane protein assembly factor BamB
MPAQGDPYAAIGQDVAALGLGTTVQAFDARTGVPRWTTDLGGPVSARPGPADGRQIVSVRSWPGVVTVGLSSVPGSSLGQSAGSGRQASGPQETEVVLDAATGREIRAYPGAPFGGTVAADSQHTVVVQPDAVTSYRNATGAAAWSVQTGAVPQAWRLDGDYLYMTVGAGGNLAGLAQQPATELRRMDLRTGADRIVRAYPGPFAGSLGAALNGVVLFTNANGVTAYSAANGRRLWSRDLQDLPQGVDLVTRRFYLSEQGGLAAVDPWTGKLEAWLPGSNGLYAERGGVALGLDEGADGSAWGVETASQRVVWTVSSLPWPHYFVDLSGLGGSADPRSDALIVASCAQATPGTTAQPCAKPELVVINR